MKQFIKIATYALAAILLYPSCSSDDKEVEGFRIEIPGIEEIIGPDGGNHALTITSKGKWQVATDATWIKVSPANGRGPAKCTVQVDSTVLAEQTRSAIIQVISEDQIRPLDFRIEQDGYPLAITVLDEDQDIELPNYGEWGSRKFKVHVKTNVPFDVDVLGDNKWVNCKTEERENDKVQNGFVNMLNSKLNRGARPRIIPLEFEWDNNTRPDERDIDVEFNPTEDVQLAIWHKLNVKQVAADLIEPGIKGDSLAILACLRSLNIRLTGPYEDRMFNWPDVVLWKITDDEVVDNPDLLGRVRSVKFSMASTKEGIPFEIQYMDALESLSFFSNGNKHLYSFSTGPYISMLKQLKHLEIYAYGISEIDENLKDLKNLETLDLATNNFDNIPDILTPENFPNLTYLSLTGNRRSYPGSMLHMPNVPQSEWAGLNMATTEDNNNALKRLLKWEKLEYLGLGHNLLQYGIPDMKDEGLPTWQAGEEYRFEWDNKTEEWKMETISQAVADLNIPKVLPNAYYFSINGSYMTGELPDWILYHPMLMWWNPFEMVFTQAYEAFDSQGNKVGFTNIPRTPDYYYEYYPEQTPEEYE